MALADLLKPKSPADLRHSISSKLLEAQSRLTQARDVYGKAEADVMEAVVEPSVAAKADAELTKVKREVDKLSAALESLDARSESFTATVEQEAHKEKWEKVLRLSSDRTKKAARYDRAGEEHSAAFLALALATDTLNNAIREVQKDPEVDGLLLWSIHIETAVRKDMFRRGLNWAFSWPWGKPGLPEFTPQFEEAEKMIRAQAASALDKLK